MDLRLARPSLQTGGSWHFAAWQTTWCRETHSYATNLVNDDGNGSFADIFVKDLITGEVRLVSNAPGGTAGNDAAFFASLSEDGRYVAFQSYASNLVPDDTNGFGADAFVRDLLTDELIIVSNTMDTTIHDRSFARPVISKDGRYVAFDSRAPGHVPDDTNNAYDIFRADTEDAWSPDVEFLESNLAEHHTAKSGTLYFGLDQSTARATGTIWNDNSGGVGSSQLPYASVVDLVFEEFSAERRRKSRK